MTSLPQLVRLYIRHSAIGFALAAVFVAGLLALDIGGLGHLVTSVNGGWLALLMLWVFNGIVFAGVQFALALPSDRSDQGSPPRRSHRLPLPRIRRPDAAAIPVPVRDRRS